MKPQQTNGLLAMTGAVVAIGLSTWSLISQRGLDERLAAESARLREVSDLDAKVAAMGRRIGRLESQTGQLPPPSAAASMGGAIQQGDGTLPANLDTVARMDPGALESLQRKYTHEQAIKQQIEKLQITRQNQQKADFEKYGTVVQELSRRAAGGGADGDAAYGELLAKYPESNAAATAIAEKGLQAAMQMDTSGVETYFTQLMSKSSGTEVVTEQGFQAASALHSYLARTYIAEGKYTEAEQIIDSLSQNYADDLVPERGNGTEPQWISGSDLASQLKTAVTNAASGLPAGPGGPGAPPSGAPSGPAN